VAHQALSSLRDEGVRVLTYYPSIAGIADDDFVLFATRYRLAVLPGQADEVARGALLMYLPVDEDVFERKALQRVKILRGTPASDIPFDTSTRFGLAVNRRTAGLLGLTIPREVLVIAEEVYD